MKNILTLCGVLALALAATGCVKFKQVWTINPDGSGKMTMTMAASEAVLQQAPEDPFANLDDPTKLMNKEDNGWVAFTKPQVSTKDGFKSVVCTGYFEDINQVTFSGDLGNGSMTATSYKLDADRFTVINGMLGQVVESIAGDTQMQDPQFKTMMGPLMKGLEMTETYTVPGPITDAEGYGSDGKTAMRTLTDEDMLATTPPSIEGIEDGELTITFTPGEWTDQDAWTAELEKAKTDWQAIKSNAAVGAESN